MQQTRTVALSSPHIDDSDVELVRQAIESRWLASGPLAEAFEREVASWMGARFAIATASGTASLHMGVIAAGVTEGDLVITSPFSFVASANVILYERAIPLFVDIDPETLTIDPAKVVEAVDAVVHRRKGWRGKLPRRGVGAEPVLRAVLPVHVFGRPAEMLEIAAACRASGVAVLEDACEALGASLDGRPVGRFGDAAAFAFYPNKQVTAGEGGMLVTDNESWDALFRSLRNQGRSADAQWLRHDRLGFNYRMDEMSAALGLSQFRRIDDLLCRREALAERYAARLSGCADVEALAPPRAGMTRSWFLYVIRLAGHVDRDRLMIRLAARGITSRPYFWPIHLQTFYMDRFGFAPGDFPCAEAAGQSMLALPMPLATGLDDVDYVCDVLLDELARP